MKVSIRMIGFVFFGLLTSVIIYPLFHEVGHTVVAVTVGAEIKEFNFFPLPFVACNLSAVNKINRIFIALGGILLPFFISMALKPKFFWLWYVNLLIKGISTYATTLSVVSIVLYNGGIYLKNDDIIYVLQIFPNSKWFLFVWFVLLSVYGIVRIIKEKPLCVIGDYFDSIGKASI